MTQSNEAAAREFYESQLRYLGDMDVDGLIDNQYNDDAVLISFQGTVVGADALKTHFGGYLEMLGKITVNETTSFAFTDDTIFFEAKVSTKMGDATVYDAWVMRDGKIAYHFTGVK